MNKQIYYRVKTFGFAAALSITCGGAALAQGMAEYAGVTGIPKPIPKSSGMAGALNSMYGTPGKSLSGAASGASAAAKTTTTQPAVLRTAQAKTVKAKKPGKPAIIMSGDLPGSAIQAQREVVLELGKAANDSFKAGLEAKKKGKLDEAEAQFRKSVSARQQYWSTTDKKIPDIFVELGDLNATRGDDKKAVEDLDNALAFYSKFYGPGSVHRIRPLLLLSTSQKRLGEKLPAYDSYKQAYLLATRAKLDEYNPVDMRLSTVKFAIEVNKFRDAVELCELATGSSERPKLSQPQLLAVMNDYATALRGLNRTRDAEEVLAEAEKIKGTDASPTAPESTEKQ